jgi:hypothetical protein
MKLNSILILLSISAPLIATQQQHKFSAPYIPLNMQCTPSNSTAIQSSDRDTNCCKDCMPLFIGSALLCKTAEASYSSETLNLFASTLKEVAAPLGVAAATSLGLTAILRKINPTKQHKD